MGKGKSRGTPIPKQNSPYVADVLYALFEPIPEGLDDHFRSSSDAPDDHLAAYERACAHTAILGETRVARLWQTALEIGFRTARGPESQSVCDRVASEGFALGREAGLKDGEVNGFEKGTAAGLSERKRLGFVAGREFGEKQATKMSKISISDRVFVDAGTDTPAADLSPLVPPFSTLASTPPNTLHPATFPPTQRNAPFNWADEPEPDHPSVPDATARPPRDFSALRSDSTSSMPFSTLQYRAHRKQKSGRVPRRSAFHSTSHRRYPASATSFYCPAAASFASKSSRIAPTSTLDWDRDPRLSDLSRVLRSMGWGREGGGGV
ncbi:hypothetical protein C8R44DRAFT_821952 [Mycena epipterygia]|nr:hypothetical protein C8R44DRAFT_821952 [Mycena epipterygia]